MLFNPEKLKIRDEAMKPFIDAAEIWETLNSAVPTKERVRDIIAKSLEKNRLTFEETAILINASDPALVEEIKEGAKTLKKKVYGDRKSTRLNSSHLGISYAVFCLKKKKQ